MPTSANPDCINDPFDLGKTLLNKSMVESGDNSRSLTILDLKAPPDTMLGTFQLTQENIQSIKKRVEAQWQEKHKQEPAIRISTFAITSAYVWVCLVKARKLGTHKVYLTVPVDCRARLEPPVPSTYFGNCVAGFVLGADSNELMGEDGVAVATKAISEGIRGLDDGVLKGVQELLSSGFSVPTEGLFSIAGSPRFQFYNTDFGWGRPRKVEMVSIDKTGAFSLSDSREGSGTTEIGIVLKKHQTEAFASMFVTGLETH